MAKVEKTITLYLAPWQKRMIADKVGTSAAKRKKLAKVSAVTLSIIDKRQWVMYRQPHELLEAGEWDLYLTDEQISQVATVLGVGLNVSAVNISAAKIKSGAVVFA
jgi:hypothetical protein